MSCKFPHLLAIANFFFVPVIFSQTNEQLRANLYVVNADGTADLYDGNLTMYSRDNSNAIDGKDAVKMSNFGENFGLARGNTTLVIERRASIETTDTIFFKLWNTRPVTYKIEIWSTGLSYQGLRGFFEDAYLNSSTPLDLEGANSYTFTLTRDPASWASDRFKIIFSRLPAQVLPLPVAQIRAYERNNQVNINWSVDDQKNITQYEVQTSEDGRPFRTVATVAASPAGKLSYQWTGSFPAGHNDLYRISGTDVYRHIQYSVPVKLVNKSESPVITVFPNPVSGHTLHFHLSGGKSGIYLGRIINNYGQVLFLTKFPHEASGKIQMMQLPKTIRSGSYHLEVIDPDNKIITTGIFLQ